MTTQPMTTKAEVEGAMRAVVRRRYGSTGVLGIEEIARPDCGPDEVVIAVRAVSVNPADLFMMTGTPLLMRLAEGFFAPKEAQLGVDVAGVLVGVGEQVEGFAVGDEVFGEVARAFAEYVCVKSDRIVHKPEGVSFEEAAAVPVAGLTALQGLRDEGQIQAGQRVLINGASGGVGTFAVQLAKHFGAHVTGVCSSRNVELVRSLGADRVVDYTHEDFCQGATYDLILDNVGNRRLSEIKGCLSSGGRYVVVSGPMGRWMGPVWRMVKALAYFKFGTRTAAAFMAVNKQEDLKYLQDLLASGALKPAIEEVYPFDQVAAAMEHLQSGARAKIVVKL